MSARGKKFVFLVLAAALVLAAGWSERRLNQDRERLGLTTAATLQNAPPVLAFTTVALGGFRGLISNFLWIRANDLQQDDKFFEAAQLADWITDLEPHFATVWVFQAWNMAYNISVKFKENAPGDYSDRWRWVQRGIELLRDRALVYNPDEITIYQQLAWFFQHKMGANLDDANLYYKRQWAEDMMPFFGPQGTNFDGLIHPASAAARAQAESFTNQYKINPVFAEKVNQEWGPLDWRTPEAHAIYWAALGLETAKEHPEKVNPEDLIQLQRVIYQCEQQGFRHGRIISNPLLTRIEMAPNLDLIPRANEAYLYFMRNDAAMSNHISTAHRNFLRDAVYFLYINNRVPEAAHWYKYLAQMYPDKPVIEGDGNPLPADMTLQDYALARVRSDLGDIPQDRTTAIIEGILVYAYTYWAVGQDDLYLGYSLLARKAYENYSKKTADTKERVPLPPFHDLNQLALEQVLDPQSGLPFAARAALRAKLGMGPETNAPPALTTTPQIAPQAATGTNAPSAKPGQ